MIERGIIRGVKTLARCDVRTFEHILSGFSMGHTIRKTNSKVFERKMGLQEKHISTRYFDIIGVLLLAYLRETLEHYLEIGLAGDTVEFWFQGVEFWGNRLISDPLMMVIGYMIAKKYPMLVMPARILSVIRLGVHVFIFPHSMYLHTIGL